MDQVNGSKRICEKTVTLTTEKKLHQTTGKWELHTHWSCFCTTTLSEVTSVVMITIQTEEAWLPRFYSTEG